MSATMDRRIADRRHSVREAGARRRMRWVLAFMLAALIGGLVGWLFFESSFLAVSEVTISGAARADVAAVVAAEVEEGMATVRVDPDRIAAAVMAEPWVVAADVTVTWPGSVAVAVLEYEPAAWVAASDGTWMLVAAQGAVLETARFPVSAHPTLDVGSSLVAPGGSVGPAAVAAIEFLSVLPIEDRLGATVTGTPDGMVAFVAGHQVKLGHPVDMAEKALALSALLGQGVPAEAPINLVSPLRPAVSDPPDTNLQAEVEGSELLPPSDEPTG